MSKKQIIECLMLSPFYFKLTPDERLEIVLSLCKDKSDLYSTESGEVKN